MMRYVTGRLWGAIFLALFIGRAFVCQAATQTHGQNPFKMDAVVVTATNSTHAIQTGDVDMETTPASVSVIQREQFEGKTTTLAEVIEKEAGVQVRQSGGLGSFSSVSLRGSTSEQVMVYLDGILLNDASGGGVDLSNIALSDVDSIEIYRGTTPINFGKASIGGAVNIRTLRADRGLSATALVGYGSFNTRKAAGYINHKPGNWDYLLSADVLASDNDFEFVNDNGTQWNLADDRDEKRNNAQFDQYNLLGKVGHDVSTTLRFDLMNQFFQKHQGLPNWSNSTLTRSTLDTTRNIATLRLTANELTPWNINTRSLVSYAFKEEEYDDRSGHIGLGDQHNTYTTRRWGADFFTDYMGTWHTLIVSAGLMSEDYTTEDYLKAQNPRDSNRRSVSAGVQDTLFVLKDKLMLTPAVRYALNRDELNSGVNALGQRLASRKRFDSYLSPQVGVKYLPVQNLALKANWARYVREPSFFELFGDRGFFLGNAELKAEKGTNFDLGSEFNRKLPYTWLQRLSVAVNYFRNDVEDLIGRAYDTRGVGKSVNIANALIQGIEVFCTVEFFDYFTAVLNATWQDPEMQSDISAFDGKSLPGRFARSYLGRLEAGFMGVATHIEYIQKEEMYYDTANLLKAEDKQEFNAGVSWLWRSFKFSLEGKNLTDEAYEDFNGFPMPGRSFYASVKYDFQ